MGGELSVEYGTRSGMILQDFYAEKKVEKFSDDGTLSFDILEELNPSTDADSIRNVLETLQDEGKIQQISSVPEDRYEITDELVEIMDDGEYAEALEEDYEKLALNY